MLPELRKEIDAARGGKSNGDNDDKVDGDGGGALRMPDDTAPATTESVALRQLRAWIKVLDESSLRYQVRLAATCIAYTLQYAHLHIRTYACSRFNF
jgi:hypothetical protein